MRWRFERFAWGIWWIDAVFSVVIGIGMLFVMYALPPLTYGVY
jgi:hypothetical protein